MSGCHGCLKGVATNDAYAVRVDGHARGTIQYTSRTSAGPTRRATSIRSLYSRQTVGASARSSDRSLYI